MFKAFKTFLKIMNKPFEALGHGDNGGWVWPLVASLGSSLLSSNSGSGGGGFSWSDIGTWGANNNSSSSAENNARDLAPFQMQAFKSQQALAASQKKMLDIFSGGYEDLVPALSFLLQNKMSATGLPADMARDIGKYYDQAGSKMGNYFSSRGMMNSGQSQQAYQQLSQEEAAKKLSTVLGQQREGTNQALSFMGGQPTASSYGTSSLPTPYSAPATAASQPADLSGMGSFFAKMFDKPTAQPMSGGDAANWGFRGGNYA